MVGPGAAIAFAVSSVLAIVDWFNNGIDAFDWTVNDVILASVAISAITVIAVFIKRLGKVARKFDTFYDDYFGTPARDGRERQPGVMERLQKSDEARVEVQTTLKDQTRKLDKVSTDVGVMKQRIDYEMTTNGGGSLKDGVVKMQEAFDSHIVFSEEWVKKTEGTLAELQERTSPATGKTDQGE